VTLALGKANVLQGCSLSVPRGQFCDAPRPAGCGKSTLLKASPPHSLALNRGQVRAQGLGGVVVPGPGWTPLAWPWPLDSNSSQALAP